MSVCLNPHEGHPAAEGSPQRPFCMVPGCRYLLKGAIIGKWRVVSFFGQGPVTSLYLATKGGESTTSSPVIVKILHAPILQPVARLEQMVNLVLALNHPYIHPLESIGLLGQSGPLYLVSPYVEQGGLAQHSLLSSRVPGKTVAALVRQMTAALSIAHEAGLVHGRLKPENCLLIDSDTVRVTDFYSPLLVETEPSFSPHYMAPEQAYDHLGPATDQYALAVLVFRLLAGRLPYDGPNRRAIIVQHVQNDPPSISPLRPDLSRQVEVVLRKALSKRPADRFPSMRAFASALQNALVMRPGDTGMLTPLDGATARPPSRPILAPTPAVSLVPSQSRFPTGAMPLSTLPGHTSDISVLRWAPDGIKLISAGEDHDIFLWGVQQKVGTMLARYEAQQREPLAVCWSPQGNLFVTSAKDATLSLWDVPATPRRAPELAGGESLGKIQKAWWGHDGRVPALDWSPDGTRIASGGSDRTVRLWDKSGRGLAGWQAHGRGGVTALAWSPDNQMLASGGADRQISVWDPTNGTMLCMCEGHTDEVRHLAWSPDGNLLASAGGKKDMRLLLWNPHTGQQLGQFHGHARHIIGMFWASDGSWLATASADRRLRFWNTGQQLGQQVCRPIEIDGTPVSMAGSASSGLVAFSLDTMSILVLQLTWK